MAQANALNALISPLRARSLISAGKLKTFEIVGAPEWGLIVRDTGAGGRTPRRTLVPTRRDSGRDDRLDPEEFGPENPDPLFPDEDLSGDTRFWIEWRLAIENDGVPLEDREKKKEKKKKEKKKAKASSKT